MGMFSASAGWRGGRDAAGLVAYEKTSYQSVTRFLGHVQLEGRAARTVESYVCIVRQLGEWAQRDPALLEEEDVREFFLHLLRDRGYAAQSMRQARASLVSFYAGMLGRVDWKVFATIKTKDIFKLPVVLTADEVRRVLDAVRETRFRVCLRLIYECGLRLTEALRIETRDIGRADRRLHVRCGKGGKERYVPLSPLMIDELSAWWRQHGNRIWMFPSIGYDAKSARRVRPEDEARAMGARMKLATKPMSESALQMAFRRAVQESGVKTHATIHTLRHSYATHLLEEGVSLRYVSQYLGHATLEQTLVYTHLTAVSEAQTQSALMRLSERVRSSAVPG
jgi:integrase/recombinase XerD